MVFKCLTSDTSFRPKKSGATVPLAFLHLLLVITSNYVFQLKWEDGYEGHGEHYYDYNHVGAPEQPSYGAPEPAYAPAPAYAPPLPSYGSS
jgi:hypothetical protein